MGRGKRGTGEAVGVRLRRRGTAEPSTHGPTTSREAVPTSIDAPDPADLGALSGQELIEPELIGLMTALSGGNEDDLMREIGAMTAALELSSDPDEGQAQLQRQLEQMMRRMDRQQRRAMRRARWQGRWSKLRYHGSRTWRAGPSFGPALGLRRPGLSLGGPSLGALAGGGAGGSSAKVPDWFASWGMLDFMALLFEIFDRIEQTKSG